ncbi:MAG: spore germination protein [Clostridia bacterium]
MIPRDLDGKTIVSRLYLEKSLEKNLEMFKELFKNDDTLVVREITIRGKIPVKVAVIFFDGMVNNLSIAESIIEPMLKIKENDLVKITAKTIANSVLEVNDAVVTDNMTEILGKFLYGDSLILVDGDFCGIVVNTKGFLLRSISEPESEKVLSGPREGFIEGFMMNLSLIRRKIKSPDLKFQFIELGTVTKTTAVICYIEGVCEREIIKTFEKRIKKFALDSAIDVNYVIESIKDSKFSPFPTMGTTERPDVFVAKILEGRVGLILDGTPVAVTAPHIFMESFQSNDDYYMNYLYANIARMLRIFGFLFNISIPSIFLAMITFHQELIPTKLLFSISMARDGVPFPAIVEALVLVFIFEILKEAGTRTPASIGQTLSIVGALVLGQAAVDARFVSVPMVIVVAFSGITALTVPKLKVPSVVFRIILLILSSIIGLYGLIFGICIIILHICSIRSFGVPYVTNISSVRVGDLKDNVFRFPWTLMRPNHRFISEDSPEETSGD